MVPKRIFLTKGVGKHKERLTSFELALRDAGIASQNLVRVSSIFPPNCKLISRKEGLKYLHHGEVAFAVVAESSTREPHRLTAASIGLAIPDDRNCCGDHDLRIAALDIPKPSNGWAFVLFHARRRLLFYEGELRIRDWHRKSSTSG